MNQNGKFAVRRMKYRTSTRLRNLPDNVKTFYLEMPANEKSVKWGTAEALMKKKKKKKKKKKGGGVFYIA